MSTETVLAETWLYTTLKADAALTALIGGATAPRIFSAVIPQEAALPAVVFQQMAGEDMLTLNAHRVWSDVTYLVKAVDQVNGFPALDAIAGLIDTALHRASGTGAAACWRERPFAYVEQDGGVQYRHLGGIYRIFAR